MADSTDISAGRQERARPQRTRSPGADAAPARDTDALDLLVRRARPRVFRWALVRTGDVDHAEDVAQEVSLRIARRPAQLDADSFWAWLYRVTVNAANDLRRKHRRGRPADTDELAALPARTIDALDALVGSETREAIRVLLESLSARQREVLQLVDIDGCSAVEAAERMGIDAATARVHLLRARRALRSRLLEEGNDDV